MKQRSMQTCNLPTFLQIQENYYNQHYIDVSLNILFQPNLPQ